MSTEDTAMKLAILRVAVQLAKAKGFRNFSRADVAEGAKTATGTVSYHYRDMTGLRRSVMQFAIDNEVLEVVAQGLVERNSLALRAPDELKRKAARAIMT